MTEFTTASEQTVIAGVPVFRGTRIPVRTLLEHLEAGGRLEDFLDGFPTVSRRQAVAVLRSMAAHLSELSATRE